MRLWWGIADILMSRQILRRSLSSLVQLQGQVVQLHFDYTKTICISPFPSDSWGDVLASTVPTRYLSTRFLTWIKATLLTWSYTMKNITWKIGIRPSVRLSTSTSCSCCRLQLRCNRLLLLLFLELGYLDDGFVSNASLEQLVRNAPQSGHYLVLLTKSQ